MTFIFTPQAINYRYVLAFVFVPLLEKDIADFVEDWNCHSIRKSGRNSISGRPDDLYCMPQLHGIYMHFS